MKREEILRKAADNCEKEGAWCQGEMARDSEGLIVGCHERSACSRCAWGHISYATGSYFSIGNPADYAFGAHIQQRIPLFNDHPDRTQAEVVQALRDCADRCERGEL